jgi:BlaI family transcriptional regulator, penicillinase repressor
MVKPSESEMRLLRPLWRQGRLSAREIHEASEQVAEWSYSSTRKTLDRMVEKGLLEVEFVHGLKTFRPTQSKLHTLAVLIDSFTRKVLGADEPLPVAAFAGSKLLSAQEIADLEALLRSLAHSRAGGGE